MSIQAGTLIYVGGNAVIDRLQSAGLGNVKVPIDVVREVGNPNVVDKVPQEPDFTFTLESFDVSTQLEAWLTGQIGDGTIAGAPGAGDAAGTAYNIDSDHCVYVNVCSPWRDPTSPTANVHFGHLVPGYYPKSVKYSFGVTASSSETIELQGGAFYYQSNAPVEEMHTGDGTTTTFATASAAVPYREGGAGGTVFRSIFGVIVAGQLQANGVDYTTTPTNSPTPAIASVTFLTAPPSGAVIKFGYFTTATRQYPQAVHASAIVKPAAVRGRNICVYVGSGSGRVLVPMVQSATLEYTVDGAIEYEFCTPEAVGYNINGTDVTGQIVSRARDFTQLAALIAKVTGVSSAEVTGWLNQNTIPLDIEIHDPKNSANILKTLHVSDAIFDTPDTPAKVNSPTDFTFGWQSQSGTYTTFKGANPSP
jgi:hypothetical protein